MGHGGTHHDALTTRLGFWVGTRDSKTQVIGANGDVVSLGRVGATYFVDADNGNNSSDGLTWDTALATMTAAFTKVKSGEVIYLRGRLLDEATTPTGVTDVTIIGSSTRPRAGNVLDGGPKRGAANWRPLATPAAPLLTVTQQGWRVVNIMFSAASGFAAVSTQRDGGATTAEKNAGHFSAIGCAFWGGLGAVWDTGGANNVHLLDCDFRNMTGSSAYAIKTVTTAIAVPLWWVIEHCRFQNNKNHIYLDSSEGLVKGCTFTGKGHGVTTVVKLDLKGPLEQGANNVVTECFLGGDFRTDSDGYVQGLGDEWTENYYEGTMEDSRTQNYYVDANDGVDTNDGKSWVSPLKTIGKAFTLVKSGAKIYIRGRFTEELTTPAAALDVTIIGVGTMPRAGGAEWRSATHPAGASPLTVVTPGWRVVNIMFRGTTAAPAISLVYDADTKWPNRFSAFDCQFQDGMGGIWDTGGTDNVEIIGCDFRNMTEESDDSYAIKTVATAIAVPLWWVIENCRFQNNKHHISLDSSEGLVKGCTFTAKGHGITTTTKLNLKGPLEQGSNNIVTECFFGGNYRDNNDEYVSGTDDEWVGNYVRLVANVEKDSGVWNLVPATQ